MREIVDVGIVVPACFENPLKQESIDFLEDALLLTKKRVILPTSTLIGAYHIATNYLGVSRSVAKSVLSELIRTGSKALYTEIGADIAITVLESAAMYTIESWDGYLVALATKLGVKVIFTLDEQLGENLKMQKDAALPIVVNPFPASKTNDYHKFLRKRIL